MAAAALTIEEWNQNEPLGIGGRPISVVHADTASQVDPFEFQATRLLAVNQAAALIGGIHADEAFRLHQALAVQERSPVALSAAGGAAALPSSGLRCIGISPSERGKWLARYVAEVTGLRPILMVTDTRYPTTLDIHRSFLREFRHPDRQVLSEHLVGSKEELEALVPKIRETQARGLVFVGRRQAFDQVLTAALPQQLTLIFAGDEEETMWRHPPDVGVIFASAYPGGEMSDDLKKFEVAFRQRCQQPLSPASLLTAESFQILLKAAQKARSFRRDALTREIDKMEVELPSGLFWFDSAGEARRPVSIFRSEQGKIRWVKTYRPQKHEKS
jgi:ABC-type branched-subunit amino acid transport system substrate-binding protein